MRAQARQTAEVLIVEDDPALRDRFVAIVASCPELRVAAAVAAAPRREGPSRRRAGSTC